MNPVAVLKAVVAGSPAARVKKLTADIAVVDRRIETSAARAADLQAALDDGDGDAAAIVANAATLQTARAERAVLLRPLEVAQRLVAEAEAEEAARQKAVRVGALRARVGALQPEIEMQLEKFVELAAESEAVRIQLDDLGVRVDGLDEYVMSVNRRTSTKSGGRERDTMSLKTLLLIPIVQQNSEGEGK